MKFLLQILETRKFGGGFAFGKSNGLGSVIGEGCQTLFFVRLAGIRHPGRDKFEFCSVVAVVEVKHPLSVFSVIFTGRIVHEAKV
ncbi:hypothetical protein D3C87_1529970 [compost metagenome]